MFPIPKLSLTLAIAATLLGLTTCAQLERARRLEAEVSTITSRKHETQRYAEELQQRLSRQAEQAAANDLAQAKLRDDIARAESLLTSRTTAIERLKRENAALRNWADAALPADVVRLRDRPELAGAAAYRDWLSARDGMPLAGEPADHQRAAVQ